jgi:hypothetical protein
MPTAEDAGSIIAEENTFSFLGEADGAQHNMSIIRKLSLSTHDTEGSWEV